MEKGHSKLWQFFGLSYAQWLTMPRVLMHAMSDDWQERIAVLLEEYDRTWANVPSFGTAVRTTDTNGKMVKAPMWLNNYRHPDYALIESFKATPSPQDKGAE